MRQHTRLKNQVMSAKVRKITSVTLSTGEADTIEAEWEAAYELIEKLAKENEEYKAKNKELATRIQAQADTRPADTTKTSGNTNPTEFSGVLDGGKF